MAARKRKRKLGRSKLKLVSKNWKETYCSPEPSRSDKWIVQLFLQILLANLTLMSWSYLYSNGIFLAIQINWNFWDPFFTVSSFIFVLLNFLVSLIRRNN
jgi:hypothetical protein